MHRVLRRRGHAFIIDAGPPWMKALGSPLAKWADPGWVAFHTGEELQRLFRGAGFADFYWTELLPHMAHVDDVSGFQLLEVRSSLPDELLMFGDKLSMAHGLEARVPYLDRTVFEFAQRLGTSLKIRRAQGKWIHRQVCADYLPLDVRRRKKRGFAVNVVDQWFHSSVNSLQSNLLLDSKSLIYQYLQPTKVRNLLKEHQIRRHDNHKLLFSLALFEEWLRKADAGSVHAADSK